MCRLEDRLLGRREDSGGLEARGCEGRKRRYHEYGSEEEEGLGENGVESELPTGVGTVLCGWQSESTERSFAPVEVVCGRPVGCQGW